MLAKVKKLSYTLKNLIPGESYNFKLLSNNCCQSKDFSPVKTVTLDSAPAKPILFCPTSECDGFIRFKWQLHRSKNLESRLTIMDADGKFHPYNNCKEESSCNIQTDDLMRTPFLLSPDSAVIARVKTRNHVGWSSLSDLNNCSIRIKTHPCTLT